MQPKIKEKTPDAVALQAVESSQPLTASQQLSASRAPPPPIQTEAEQRPATVSSGATDPVTGMRPVKSKIKERITIIRGSIICARNIVKDITVGDGISLTETEIKRCLDDLNPEAWRTYEKRERARAARGTLSPWLPQWLQHRKPLRNENDAFGDAEVFAPNPYVVVRAVDPEGKGLDLVRTEPLVATESPCWDVAFRADIPEHMANVRRLELCVYDAHIYSNNKRLGLLPWDRGDPLLGRTILDLESVFLRAQTEAGELVGTRGKEIRRPRLIYQVSAVRKKMATLQDQLCVRTNYQRLITRMLGLYGIQSIYKHCLGSRSMPPPLEAYGLDRPYSRSIGSASQKKGGFFGGGRKTLIGAAHAFKRMGTRRYSEDEINEVDRLAQAKEMEILLYGGHPMGEEVQKQQYQEAKKNFEENQRKKDEKLQKKGDNILHIDPVTLAKMQEEQAIQAEIDEKKAQERAESAARRDARFRILELQEAEEREKEKSLARMLSEVTDENALTVFDAVNVIPGVEVGKEGMKTVVRSVSNVAGEAATSSKKLARSASNITSDLVNTGSATVVGVGGATLDVVGGGVKKVGGDAVNTFVGVGGTTLEVVGGAVGGVNVTKIGGDAVDGVKKVFNKPLSVAANVVPFGNRSPDNSQSLRREDTIDEDLHFFEEEENSASASAEGAHASSLLDEVEEDVIDIRYTSEKDYKQDNVRTSHVVTSMQQNEEQEDHEEDEKIIGTKNGTSSNGDSEEIVEQKFNLQEGQHQLSGAQGDKIDQQEKNDPDKPPSLTSAQAAQDKPAFTVQVIGVFTNGEEIELHQYRLVTSFANHQSDCPEEMLLSENSTALGINGAFSQPKLRKDLLKASTRLSSASSSEFSPAGPAGRGHPLGDAGLPPKAAPQGLGHHGAIGYAPVGEPKRRGPTPPTGAIGIIDGQSSPLAAGIASSGGSPTAKSVSIAGAHYAEQPKFFSSSSGSDDDKMNSLIPLHLRNVHDCRQEYQQRRRSSLVTAEGASDADRYLGEPGANFPPSPPHQKRSTLFGSGGSSSSVTSFNASLGGRPADIHWASDKAAYSHNLLDLLADPLDKITSKPTELEQASTNFLQYRERRRRSLSKQSSSGGSYQNRSIPRSFNSDSRPGTSSAIEVVDNISQQDFLSKEGTHKAIGRSMSNLAMGGKKKDDSSGGEDAAGGFSSSMSNSQTPPSSRPVTPPGGADLAVTSLADGADPRRRSLEGWGDEVRAAADRHAHVYVQPRFTYDCTKDSPFFEENEALLSKRNKVRSSKNIFAAVEPLMNTKPVTLLYLKFKIYEPIPHILLDNQTTAQAQWEKAHPVAGAWPPDPRVQGQYADWGFGSGGGGSSIGGGYAGGADTSSSSGFIWEKVAKENLMREKSKQSTGKEGKRPWSSASDRSAGSSSKPSSKPSSSKPPRIPATQASGSGGGVPDVPRPSVAASAPHVMEDLFDETLFDESPRPSEEETNGNSGSAQDGVAARGVEGSHTMMDPLWDNVADYENCGDEDEVIFLEFGADDDGTGDVCTELQTLRRFRINEERDAIESFRQDHLNSRHDIISDHQFSSASAYAQSNNGIHQLHDESSTSQTDFKNFGQRFDGRFAPPSRIVRKTQQMTAHPSHGSQKILAPIELEDFEEFRTFPVAHRRNNLHQEGQHSMRPSSPYNKSETLLMDEIFGKGGSSSMDGNLQETQMNPLPSASAEGSSRPVSRGESLVQASGTREVLDSDDEVETISSMDEDVLKSLRPRNPGEEGPTSAAYQLRAAPTRDHLSGSALGPQIAEGCYFLNDSDLGITQTIQVELRPAQDIQDLLQTQKMQTALMKLERGLGRVGRKNRKTAKKRNIISRILHKPFANVRKDLELKASNLRQARRRAELLLVNATQDMIGKQHNQAAFEDMKDLADEVQAAMGQERRMVPVRWRQPKPPTTKALLFFDLKVLGNRYQQESELDAYLLSEDFQAKMSQVKRARRLQSLKDEKADGPKLEPEIQYCPKKVIRRVYGRVIQANNISVDARATVPPPGDDLHADETLEKWGLLSKDIGASQPFRSTIFGGVGGDLAGGGKSGSNLSASFKASANYTSAERARAAQRRSQKHYDSEATVSQSKRALELQKKVSATGHSILQQQLHDVHEDGDCAHLYISCTVLDKDNIPWFHPVLSRSCTSIAANALGQCPLFNSDFCFSFDVPEDGKPALFEEPAKIEFVVYQKADAGESNVEGLKRAAEGGFSVFGSPQKNQYGEGEHENYAPSSSCSVSSSMSGYGMFERSSTIASLDEEQDCSRIPAPLSRSTSAPTFGGYNNITKKTASSSGLTRTTTTSIKINNTTLEDQHSNSSYMNDSESFADLSIIRELDEEQIVSESEGRKSKSKKSKFGTLWRGVFGGKKSSVGNSQISATNNGGSTYQIGGASSSYYYENEQFTTPLKDPPINTTPQGIGNNPARIGIDNPVIPSALNNRPRRFVGPHVTPGIRRAKPMVSISYKENGEPSPIRPRVAHGTKATKKSDIRTGLDMRRALRQRRQNTPSVHIEGYPQLHGEVSTTEQPQMEGHHSMVSNNIEGSHSMEPPPKRLRKRSNQINSKNNQQQTKDMETTMVVPISEIVPSPTTSGDSSNGGEGAIESLSSSSSQNRKNSRKNSNASSNGGHMRLEPDTPPKAPPPQIDCTFSSSLTSGFHNNIITNNNAISSSSTSLINSRIIEPNSYPEQMSQQSKSMNLPLFSPEQDEISSNDLPPPTMSPGTVLHSEGEHKSPTSWFKKKQDSTPQLDMSGGDTQKRFTGEFKRSAPSMMMNDPIDLDDDDEDDDDPFSSSTSKLLHSGSMQLEEDPDPEDVILASCSVNLGTIGPLANQH